MRPVDVGCVLWLPVHHLAATVFLHGKFCLVPLRDSIAAYRWKWLSWTKSPFQRIVQVFDLHSAGQMYTKDLVLELRSPLEPAVVLEQPN